MHILVTGGCGYIGSVLTPKLLNLGHSVTVYDIQWFGNFLPEHKNLKVIRGDIRNTDEIPMEGIDAIIHLANIANDPCGDLNAKLAWEVNVLATMGMVEKAIAHKVKQFILSSSGSVYGVKDELKVTEDLSLVPISDYNKTKMISERVLLSYKDLITVQCVRPATVCGFSPRMRLDVSVNMLTMQALTNGRITVFGGDQTRPNIHIQDITNVFIHFLNLGDKAPGVFNAGFENISILDIAKRVTEHVPAEIIVSESNDPRSYRINSDKLLSTGFTQKYTVNDAILGIIEAFRAGDLKDRDLWYNIRTMKQIENLE
ncbi:MAG: NAD-dependent epimerase/dehydratase [Deltaproteobacteria bacterium HGW-Deltaproteobacteria-6]|jgi:nucleoside-diphosphate-sugar epimerase|nr:MAG: NAD-dependent epimerase/dehydratase [Deltaproteobacteria bacterium HGW-Deltaproteobacteria-6]PKN95962.1 MAG: NAD-dependent epimerase/dehydratase [Chloroflexi bacterium HGW-Chloroflexi-5]